MSRPEGWSDATHGSSVAPDLERVFAEGKVHRIDIQLAPETYARAWDQVGELVSLPGGGQEPDLPSEMSREIPDSAVEACGGILPGERCELAPGLGGECLGLGPRAVCVPDMILAEMPEELKKPIGDDLMARDPDYFAVTVRYEGQVWEKVGMRFKGNSSLALSWLEKVRKLAFRLHFDRLEDLSPETRDQRFHGFRKLTFASGYNDPSMLRDKLSAEIFRAHGVPVARVAFYRVHVDLGEGPVYWGLYHAIEDPADSVYRTRFDSAEGNLYKPAGAGADWSAFDPEGFAKKTREEESDWSDVVHAMEVLHGSREDGAAWRASLEEVFDVDGFLTVLAVSRALGHWDGYGMIAHNYYVYADPSQGGRFRWIPWDHNLALLPFPIPMLGELSVMMDEVGAHWPLIRFVLDDPVYRARYRALLGEVLEGPYAVRDFERRARDLQALIAPHVVGSAGEFAPYTHLQSTAHFERSLEAEPEGVLAQAAHWRGMVEAALH